MATRWGIAGAGLISKDFVNAISSLKNESGHKVVAVAARKLGDAQEFAKMFDVSTAHCGYESLAQDPNVDVVYIGVIHPFHNDLVKMMLNNGKHVLCEKPLGMNVKETKEMLELAQAKKLFLMEAVWSRCQPSYIKLKEELDKGALGRLYQANVTFGINVDVPRLQEKKLGGGTTLDLGIYCIQFIQHVFNGERPLKILAAGHLNEEEVDQSVAVTFIYKDGKTACFQTHVKTAMPCEASVYGEKGSMKLPYPFWSSNKLVTVDGNTQEFPLPEGKYPFNFPNSAGLGYEAQHVRECLQQGLTESPKVSHADTLLFAELMEKVRKEVGVVYPQD